jgi:hypothetical protein
VRLKAVELGDVGVVVKGRRLGSFTIEYEDILTVERLRSGLGVALHTRGRLKPVRLRCWGSQRSEIEARLRFMGVRIVDCWGAIIAPTLLDFEQELAREPIRVRQSSDNG